MFCNLTQVVKNNILSVQTKVLRLIPAVAFAAVSASAVLLSAATWNGSVDSNWSTAANWDVAPVAGDALVFSDVTQTNQPLNNNIVGGQFSGITFNANSFINDVGSDDLMTVSGNSFQLGSGGIIASSIGANRKIDVQNDIVLAANATIGSNQAGTTLELSGDISGSFGLLKGSGSGTVRLSGNNSFTGGIVYPGDGGTIEFTTAANTGVSSALGANGTINIRSAGLVYVGTDPAGHVTNRSFALQSGGGNLNGLAASGVGTLEITSNFGSGSRNNQFYGTGVGIMSGTVTLSGGASYSFVKNGTGTWILSGTTSNNISRGRINDGTVIAAKDGALGTGMTVPTNQWLIESGGTLGFQGNINYSTQTPLLVSGAGDTDNGHTGAIANISGTNSFAGDIALAGNTTFGADAGVLTLTGLIAEDSALNSYTLTKNGPGTLVLAHATGNTYQGGTVVQQGTLYVNNATGSATGTGAVSVGSDATLAGPGSISGALTLDGQVSPGQSPGVLTLGGGATFNDGSGYLWQINDATGTEGINFDHLDITGSLAFTATGADPFVLSIESLDALNLPGEMSNFNKDVDNSWNIATATGGILGLTSNNYLIDKSGIQNELDGFFTLVANGNDLVLNYTAFPIPEPNSFVLLGLGSLLVIRRRRSRGEK